MSFPKNTSLKFTPTATTSAPFQAGPFTYAWDFGDGSTSTLASPTHSYSTSGQKTASVVATNTLNNQSASYSSIVDITNYTWAYSGTPMPSYIRSPLSGNISSTEVISAGGRDLSANTVKTYTFDGVSWSAAGDMVKARSSFNNNRPVTTVKLPNGKILVCGNNAATSGVGITSEIYDPALRTWSISGNMNFDRSYYCHPILLPDGRVLVYGGLNISASPTNGYDFYDYNTGIWTSGGTHGTTSEAYVIPPVLLLDGRAFFCSSVSGQCRIFNYLNDTWSNAAAFSGTGAINQGSTCMVVGGDGNVYFFGYNGSDTKLCARYNVGSNTWTQLASYSFVMTPPGIPFLLSGGRYILIPSVSVSGGAGSVIYDTQLDSFITQSAYVNQAASLGSDARDNGFGTIGGKPVVWCNASDTVAPYGNAEIFDAY